MINKLSMILQNQRLLEDVTVDLTLLRRGLQSNSKPPANIELLKRISRSYSSAKSIENMPSPYVLGGMWKKIVEKNYQPCEEAIDNDDYLYLHSLLANFFRNETGDGLVFNKYSKVVGYNTLKRKKYTDDLLRRRDFVQNYHKNSDDIYAPALGNIFGLRDNKGIYSKSSLRHYHYARRVRELISDIPNPTVAEIGGGYGGFAYFLLRDRPDITYINFDIPQTLLTCSYYLLSLFANRKVNLFEDSIINDEINIHTGEVTLYPNFMLPLLPVDSVDLFINTGSLSEMDYETVTEYVQRIQKSTRKYFLTENSDASGVNRGHKEVALRDFSIDRVIMKEIYTFPSMLGAERYMETLFEKIERERA